MKETVTFKSFFRTIWKGFVQAVKWTGETIGLRGGNRYTKVLRHIVGTCITVWMLAGTYRVVDYKFGARISTWWTRVNNSGSFDYCDKKSLSQNAVFYKPWDSDKGFIYNVVDGRTTLNKVDWVVSSDMGDTLAVFAQDDLRGFVNTNNGEVVVPAKYKKAWLFSEGRAAVQLEDELIFIDREGNEVLRGDWKVELFYGVPLFRDGYCEVLGGKTYDLGLIDKNGDWMIEPEYYSINRENGLWITYTKDWEYSIYSADFQKLLPGTYENITIQDNCILAQPHSAPRRAYDFSGNLINDCVIENTYIMKYISGQETYVSDGELITDDVKSLASCRCYSVKFSNSDIRYGLMDKNGKRITEPLYSYISAISQDTYHCDPHGIIIDSAGNLLE